MIGITAGPASAQPRNACQDLANQVAAEKAMADTYLAWGLFYYGIGDYENMEVAYGFQRAYLDELDTDIALARSVGCMV